MSDAEFDPTVKSVIAEMKRLSQPQRMEGMARFGINVDKAFGVSIPEIRLLARNLGKDHELAGALWQTGWHEARILASMIDRPELVNKTQMENWAACFNSWDLCDQVVMNLFEDTAQRWPMAVEWSGREPEFVKRAGFVLMARLAFTDRSARDDDFLALLPIIEREADDPRNYVKKAVNWALRQIGKRNHNLRKHALGYADRLAEGESTPAKWVGRDAIRELTAPKTIARLKN